MGRAAPLLDLALSEVVQHGEKVRLIGETSYQAGSWAGPRRMVYKAEAQENGPNTCFVVTDRTVSAQLVYDNYVDRREPENWIKELKHRCFADHLSFPASGPPSSGCS